MTGKITIGQAANIIRERVTMPELMRACGIEAENVRSGWRRIRCPIHHGTDKNFSYNDKGFLCWVCGAKGDTIKFIELYMDMPRTEAMQQINSLLRLNIPIDGFRQKNEGARYRELNLKLLAQRLASDIEYRLNLEYDGHIKAGRDEEAAELIGTIFLWDVYGKEVLKEYAAFVIEQNDIFNSEKERLIKRAAENWKPDLDSTWVTARAFYPDRRKSNDDGETNE